MGNGNEAQRVPRLLVNHISNDRDDISESASVCSNNPFTRSLLSLFTIALKVQKYTSENFYDLLNMKLVGASPPLPKLSTLTISRQSALILSWPSISWWRFCRHITAIGLCNLCLSPMTSSPLPSLFLTDSGVAVSGLQVSPHDAHHHHHHT